VKNGLIVMFLVVACLSSLAFIGGVAAQNPVERTEPPAGAMLGSGKYVVSWVVASGGYEAKGSFAFTVADQSKEENDNLVTIALATFGVAGAATVVGLLGYLLRVRLGLVKPPPPPDEVHGPH
jgi:hypothetical protein